MQKLVYPSLKTGLVGAWCPSVDRSRSTLLTDLSGYGNNGTLTNMDPGTDWVASDGKIALDFDGTNDCVDLGDLSLFDFGAGDFTFSLWMRANSLPTSSRYQVLSKDSATGRQVLIESNNTGSAATVGGISLVVFMSDSTIHGQSTPANVLTAGAWAHVIATRTDSGLGIYINGVSQSLSSVPGSIALGTMQATTTACRIGSRVYSGFEEYFPGQFDDIRIYNRAITPSEISLLAKRRGIGYETYRVPIVRGAVAGGVTVTPTTVALTATKFAPTVLTPQTVTPPTEVLGSTGFAPTVSTPVTVTPSTTVLGASGFAPTVTATGDVTVTPVTTVLGATGFIPTVSTVSGLTVTPPTTALGITTFAPLPPTQALMLQELWTLTQRLKLDVDLLFALLR